ncbi:response regulator [bacterium]|nr:response regulator [bacterium]
MDYKGKVLVVDDEKDTRTFFTTLLSDQGYEVAEAENGVEAMEKLETFQPDLVTLDLSMPEKSGLGFYRDVREAGGDVPVIIITGIVSDMKQFIEKQRKVPPPEGYLGKPVDQKEMLALVERLMKVDTNRQPA